MQVTTKYTIYKNVLRISELSKVTEYKVNIQSNVFDWKLKLKKIAMLSLKWNFYVLSMEKYISSLCWVLQNIDKSNIKYLNQRLGKLCSWVRRRKSEDVNFPPSLDSEFNIISVEIPAGIFGCCWQRWFWNLYGKANRIIKTMFFKGRNWTSHTIWL